MTEKIRNFLNAEQIHQKAKVIDGHCDTIINIINKKIDFGIKNSKGHLDIPRLREGGVDIQVFAIYVEDIYKPNNALKRTLQMYDIFIQEIENQQRQLSLITDYDQIEKIEKQHKIGAILSIEGGESLEGDLGVLRVLYQLGFRLITLTWNHRNQIADGVGEARTNGGLTEFGVKVVGEMNRLGMLIDVSHLSEKGFWDVIQTSKHSVIASHSNAYALCPHPRNLKDEQVKALSDRGGVVGVTFVPNFLTNEGKNATIEDVLNHIDHFVEVGGINCVGIGSDFDGTRYLPYHLDGADKMSNITAGLVKRGYKETDILKILGGNFLRVFREIMKKTD